LNFARATILTGAPLNPSRPEMKSATYFEDDVLDVGHPVEGLGGRRRVNIDLNRSLPAGKNIVLELWGISMT